MGRYKLRCAPELEGRISQAKEDELFFAPASHAALYTSDETGWQRIALRRIEAIAMGGELDPRERRSAEKVVTFIVHHRQNGYRCDGLPFFSFSINQLATTAGLARDTTTKAVRLLCNGSGEVPPALVPLQKGQGNRAGFYGYLQPQLCPLYYNTGKRSSEVCLTACDKCPIGQINGLTSRGCYALYSFEDLPPYLTEEGGGRHELA